MAVLTLAFLITFLVMLLLTHWRICCIYSNLRHISDINNNNDDDDNNCFHWIDASVSETCCVFQTQRDTQPKSSVTQRPELVDDFVRNFLVRMNMHRTLDCFQTEW